MKSKRIPKEYKGLNCFVFCNKQGCCTTISSKGKKCVNKPSVLARNCPHKDKHIYQSRIWNKITQKRIVKSWSGVEDFEEFFELHQAFKKELKRNDYNIVVPAKSKKPKALTDAAMMFMDFQADDSELVAEHEKKNLSEKHLADQSRYVSEFLLSLKKSGYVLSTLTVDSIDSKIVGVFVKHLNKKVSASGKNKGSLISNRSWNAHIITMRVFYNFLIKKGYQVVNYFNDVKLKNEKTNPQILELEDIEKLLEVITPENGMVKNRNYYRSYLKDAILAHLLIGARPEAMVYIKCSDIENNYIYPKNRKQSSIDNEEVTDIIPITKDLAELLLRLNAYNDSNRYLIAPERNNRKDLQDDLSRAFSHYWKLLKSKKYLTIHKCRATYITNAKMMGAELIHHKNKGTQDKFYVNREAELKHMVGENMYNL